jgi:hypothetical protein
MNEGINLSVERAHGYTTWTFLFSILACGVGGNRELTALKSEQGQEKKKALTAGMSRYPLVHKNQQPHESVMLKAKQVRSV